MPDRRMLPAMLVVLCILPGPAIADSALSTAARHIANPQKVGEAISEKTKAIMVVHNLGIPAKMDEIMSLADHHDLIVIEDCCEAHGSYYKGKQVGSIGPTCLPL